MAMAKREGGNTGSTTSSASSSSTATASPSLSSAASSLSDLSAYPSDCPPDVDTLGNHTWTFLHSLSASYPERASPSQQSDMRSFLSLFAKLYPCWVCAEDFTTWMAQPGNQPRVQGQDEFGQWMCQAHNEVNRKLGKDEFDCARWKERWRDGWKDGRCG
jgi:FAD-linked sulfhydryl oxidase